MESLRLYFLGPPRIERAAEVRDLDTRKATALLAYLALSGERQTRDTLAALLWPEFDGPRARAALRRTLSVLKTAVGEQALAVTRETIGLVTSAAWCDVWEFRRLLALENGTPSLETAVHLFRGDFLAGFSLRDSIPFDDWQVWQAENLRRELETALAVLVAESIARGDYAAALPLAHRWLSLDTLREEVHRTLMELYALSGQPNAALRQYRDCVRILDEELGVAPLPETTALHEAIQSNRISVPAAPPPPRASVTPPPAAALPLVGRAAELARIRQSYARTGQIGQLLAIEGETGVGKTRLAEAFLDQMRTQGAVLLQVRCYAGESNLAYAPLIQILREGLAQPGVEDRLTSVAPAALAEAARLLPELAVYQPAAKTAEDLNAPGAQSRFFDGVGQVLAALLAGPAPGVLWIDDSHWLDTASLDLLLFWMRRHREQPFLLLVAWREEELAAEHPLRQAASEMQRAGMATTIHLERFTREELRQLLQVVPDEFPEDLPARLYAETEGLPYFVVEYLSDLRQRTHAPHQAAAWEVPRSVRDLLHARLAQVGEAERQVMQAAAVIGHAFAFDLLHAVSGRSEEEALTALEHLLARCILAEETAVYDFSHEKLRALAYEETSLARRRLLHRRVAEALAQLASREGQAAAWAGQIGTHYHLSGRDATAAGYFRLAGDYARSLYAHRDALAHYQMALALGSGEVSALHEACGDLTTLLGEYAAALHNYETAAALAPAADLGRIEYKMAEVYERQGAWHLAEQRLQRASQSYGAEVDTAVAAQLDIAGSRVAYRQGNMEQALALAERALRQLAGSGETAAMAQARNILGMLARSQGDLKTASEYLQQSLHLADSSDDLQARIAARNNLSQTLLGAGDIAAARELLQQALALCQTYGDRHQEAALHSNLADLLHTIGEEEDAMLQLKEAAAIFAEIGREEGAWQAEIWKLTEW